MKRGAPGAEDARIAAVCEEHAALVYHEVNKIAARLPSHVAREDLLTAGRVGLMEAARRFDPRRGTWASFACRRIRYAVFDELRLHASTGSHLRNRVREVHLAQNHLEQTLQRSPTVEELRLELGLSPRELERLIEVRDRKMASLSEDAAGDASEIEDRSALDRVEIAPIVGALRDMVERLPVRERVAVDLHYFHDAPDVEIAIVLGMRRNSVWHLRRRAIRRLREWAEGRE